MIDVIRKRLKLLSGQKSQIWRFLIHFGESFYDYQRYFSSRFFVDTNFDVKNSILLASTARSGSTWVANLIINYKNEYRYILEPFSLFKDRFSEGLYLRPTNQKKYYLHPAQLLLSGRIKNRNWIDRHNRKLVCKKRLIKTNFSNLLLGWLKANLPEMSIVLLLRHPCAVAHSKLRLNWSKPSLKLFFAQDNLVKDFLNPFRREIAKSQTPFEKFIFHWCIENYVPLKQFKKDDIHVAFYENFCVKPLSEITKLFSFLGKDLDKKVFRTLKKASFEAKSHSAILRGTNLIESWREGITETQIQRAVNILALFGLDRIYSEASMPLVDNLTAIRILSTKSIST